MTRKEYSVMPAIVQHYAPKGKWPAWRDAPYAPVYAASIKTGKTIDERMKTYRMLCHKAGKELTVESGGSGTFDAPFAPYGFDNNLPIKYADSLVLRNCSSWARFIVNDEAERAALQAGHQEARQYWADVAAEAVKARYYKIV